jgi:hypothetical protein
MNETNNQTYLKKYGDNDLIGVVMSAMTSTVAVKDLRLMLRMTSAATYT